MREPKHYQAVLGDSELTVYEWAGSDEPVLLLHATGFHSRCWNQVVAHLPGRHIYAADLRFHGGSSKHGEADWRLMANDICQLVDHLQLSHATGAGHSLGGHILARVAARMPNRFKHLILIDPVIMSPQRAEQSMALTRNMIPTDHPVSRRKNQWRDADEMFMRFKDKKPFDTWQPTVLRDYCDSALRPAEHGGQQTLACNPIDEARIYLNREGMTGIFDELKKIRTPTWARIPPRIPIFTGRGNSAGTGAPAISTISIIML